MTTKAGENMSIGRSDYAKQSTTKTISSDDPNAIEHLIAKLNVLESSTPRNSAEISRIKKRIALLRRIDKLGHYEGRFPGGRYQTNEEINRIQVIFEEAPDEKTVKELKRYTFRALRSGLEFQASRTPTNLRRIQRLAQQLCDPIPPNLSIPMARKLFIYAQTLAAALSSECNAPAE